MVKKILTPTMIKKQADATADIYADLQQQIFYLLIDATKNTRSLMKNNEHPLEWRLKMLQKLGGLTDEVIKLVSRYSGVAESRIKVLINDNGLTVANQINGQLATMLRKHEPISPEVHDIIKSYSRQTFRDIDNNVNQTLLTTNYGENSATKMFQDVINKTTLDMQIGRKTPQRALVDNIHQWQDKGLKTSLIDKGGHQWSLEGYTRTVLDSTSARTFNDVRIQSMKDFDSVLAVMTSHPAAREACSKIQGKVVSLVPTTDGRYNRKYPSIYEHGYGYPAGTLGINCAHRLYPYVEGVSHNFQEQYNPKQAVKNAGIQQKQRYYQRSIRQLKYKLDTAERAGDAQKANQIKHSIRNQQAKVRDLVKDNDFLTRQRQFEQVVIKK
ncbi:phage minor capsid protein [Weissella thailandensis]|uniref:phage minor capsid protein n=1 Tax=Weissella thailandensis TaxID=89061 RepID=UPI0027E514D2|nr:phage minor capsid protein [Weissella thailandensis]